MLKRILLASTVGLALFIPYRLNDTGVHPVAKVLPDLPVFPTMTIKNITGRVELLGEHELVGPESLVQAGSYLFVTLGDGRIARLSDDSGHMSYKFIARTGEGTNCGFSPSDEAQTEAQCGRPLGLTVVKRSIVDPNYVGEEEDVLLVADAYKGLLMISDIYKDTASITVLATRANSDREDYQFQLLNSVVQAPDGSIYVSETSQQFLRRRIFFAAFDGGATGRLLRYTPNGGVDVVADGIYMPNGLALSHDGKSILVVAGVQVLQFPLDSAAEPTLQPFVYVLPGTGDNIDAMDHLPSGEPRKCYWAGLGSKFAQPFSLLKFATDKPLLKSILVALVPYKVIVNLIPKLSALAVYDTDGTLIEVYKDDSNIFPWVSEGESFGGYLYLGSWYNPFLARVKVDENVAPS